MERAAWTEERLDDLSRRVDAGFAEVKEEMRAGFAEVKEDMRAGFGRVDQDVRELRTDVNASAS